MRLVLTDIRENDISRKCKSDRKTNICILSVYSDVAELCRFERERVIRSQISRPNFLLFQNTDMHRSLSCHAVSSSHISPTRVKMADLQVVQPQSA